MTESTRLHVVHIITGLGQGGAEASLFRLLTAANQPHRHTVISMTGDGIFGPRLRDAGIEVVTLNMPAGRLTVTGSVRLYGLLRRLDVDVVQTWMYHANLVGGLAARLAGIGAVSWGIRNSGTNSRFTRVIALAGARLSGHVPAAIVSCAHEAAARHRQWGYDSKIMRVIPNGYDVARWQCSAAARGQLRAEWGVQSTAPVLGMVARWHANKDHKNLLAAVAQVVGRHPGLRLVLAGEGMESRNQELAALLNRFQLRNRVILLGPRDDVPAVMTALDVHTLSSRVEGFPNVVAEAMAVGVANVVTDVGDAAHILGGCGWVAPPEDSAALAQAIDLAVRTLGTPEMATRLESGRERVTREFSVESMVSAYDVLWRRLARRHRLLLVVNNPAFFLSHRLPVAQAARAAGFDVQVATMDGPAVAEITAHGFTHYELPMSRSGRNPFREIGTFVALWRMFRRVRPGIVHAVTIKPVLYGGLAARLAGVPAYLAAVSGLGFVFVREGWGHALVRRLVLVLYRQALGHQNCRVVVQNADDRDMLVRVGAADPAQVVIVPGSGVDLSEFQSNSEVEGSPVAIMVSRLLYEKGIAEFVEAARLTAGHESGLRWVLAGGPDPGNPGSVDEATFSEWREEGVVDCLGERRDIASLYASAHIAVLPSYREGLPKSLIEAAASGRAVVTTDVPGCRDAVAANESGVLVPPRDARALADAVLMLATDCSLRRQMGQAGRRLAAERFDVRVVQRRHVDLYRELSAWGTRSAGS